RFDAVHVIANTFIDNAIKYSPRDGEITITMHDRDDEFIDFAVTSWGPLIKRGEEDDIFNLFFRGAAAQAMVDEGSGYGLYVSQLICEVHLGTEITVMQQWSVAP